MLRALPYPARSAALALGATLLACDGGKPPDDTSPAAGDTCPNDATGEVPGGDANGDGAVDLADAVVILRHVAEAGPEPVCPAGIDLIPNEVVDLDDAFSLLLYLYEGAFSLPRDVDCDGATPLPAPACAPIEARFAGTTLELRADVAIEGWSLSVHADGCTIEGATTANTAAASVVDDPPGVRDFGYDATFVVDEGAVSTVILGFLEPYALPTGVWSPVLALTPDEACGCTLSVGGAPLSGLGEPVESLVVAGGAAWPITASVELDPC